MLARPRGGSERNALIGKKSNGPVLKYIQTAGEQRREEGQFYFLGRI
jgi:hypothetical protein